MNKVIKSILSVSLLFAGAVNASDTYCSDTVEGITIWRHGLVAINPGTYTNSTDYWILCDLSGTNSEACKAIYSAALAAFTAQKKITVKFSTTEFSSCSTVPVWDTTLPNKVSVVQIVN